MLWSPCGWVMFCPGSPGFLTRCLPVSQLLRPGTQAEPGPPGTPAAGRGDPGRALGGPWEGALPGSPRE